MGRGEQCDARVAWLIVGGQHEYPALAGDLDIEELVAGLTRHPDLASRARLLWLGAHADLPRRELACEVVLASKLDVEQHSRRIRESFYAEATLVKLLLCAPLRYHASEWWVYCAAESTRRMFALPKLLEQLAPEASTPYEVIVPAVRAWHGCPSAAPVDLPDRAALNELEQTLREKSPRISCWLAAPPLGHFPHAREYSSDFHDVLTGASIPAIDELACGFAAVKEPAASRGRRVLLLGDKRDPVRWSERLSEYLRATGIEPSSLDERASPTSPAVLCVLQDAALIERAALHPTLEAWRSAGAQLLLLDRATTPGADAADVWRLPDAWRRGPQRALEQALWLCTQLPDEPPVLTASQVEGLRRSIADAFKALRGPRLNDAIGDLGPLPTENDIQFGAQPDLAARLERLLPLIGSDPALCFPSEKVACQLNSHVRTLIDGWKKLRFGVPAPTSEPRAEESVLRPIKVRVTYTSRNFPGAFHLLADPHLELSPEAVTTPGELALASGDVWLHAARNTAELLPNELTSRAPAALCIRQQALRDTADSDDELVARLRADLEDLLRPHRVFLSYAREDVEFVRSLSSALERRGIRCWRDTRDARGGILMSELEREIHKCQATVAVLSKSALQSHWVKEEIRIALALESSRKNAMVLHPIFLEGVEVWEQCRKQQRLRRHRERHADSFERNAQPPEFQRSVQRLMDGLMSGAGVIPRPDLVNPKSM